MPGCASTPGPSSEHDEDAPPPLDDYDTDIEEHYEEDRSREEQRMDEHSSFTTPSPQGSKEAVAQKLRPKVIVEPLRRTPSKAEPLRPSPPVITLREEAKEELEQFQGVGLFLKFPD